MLKAVDISWQGVLGKHVFDERNVVREDFLQFCKCIQLLRNTIDCLNCNEGSGQRGDERGKLLG